MKDVARQQARGRGGLIDQALVQRRRKDALAKLGESIYRMSQRGTLGELALDPEIAMALADVESSGDSGLFRDEELESYVGHGGPEAVSSKNYRPESAATARRGEQRVWRPVMPPDPEDPAVEDGELEGDTQQDLALPDGMAEEQGQPTKTALRSRRSAMRSAGGGINFVEEEARPGDADSDDDLESYMHDDDVPQ